MHDGPTRVGQTFVLHSLVRDAIGTLQLDTDGEVVASDTISEAGFASVPGSVGEGDELHERAVAANQQMRGNLQACNPIEAFVGMRVKAIAEEPLDVRSPELAWRQTDSVHDDQADVAAGRSGIEVR